MIHVLAAAGLDWTRIVQATPPMVALGPLPAIDGNGLDRTNHGLRRALTRWLRVLAAWAPDGPDAVEREVENQPADARSSSGSGLRSIRRLWQIGEPGVLSYPQPHRPAANP